MDVQTHRNPFSSQPTESDLFTTTASQSLYTGSAFRFQTKGTGGMVEGGMRPSAALTRRYKEVADEYAARLENVARNVELEVSCHRVLSLVSHGTVLLTLGCTTGYHPYKIRYRPSNPTTLFYTLHPQRWIRSRSSRRRNARMV